MQAWKHLHHWSMPSSITLCSTPAHTHQSDAVSNCSHSALLSDRHVAPDFVVSWIRSGLFSGHKSGSSYWWPWLLHFQTAGSEWRTVCQGIDTTCGKDHDQQNLSKMTMWFCSTYNEIASDVMLRVPKIPFISSRQTMQLNVLIHSINFWTLKFCKQRI